MPNPEWTINALEFRGGYILRLWFEDGSVKDFDCTELLDERVYSPLRSMSFFRQAQALYGSVRWNEDIDIAPEYLYEHGEDVNLNIKVEDIMPEIARFFGIRIVMCNDEHNSPHFHATYANDEASFDLNGNMLNGSLPARYRKYVEVWADIHRQELEENWEKARNNEELTSIKGLN